MAKYSSRRPRRARLARSSDRLPDGFPREVAGGSAAVVMITAATHSTANAAPTPQARQPLAQKLFGIISSVLRLYYHETRKFFCYQSVPYPETPESRRNQMQSYL